MAPDSLRPNDPRVEHKFAIVGGGHKYHYIVAKPQSTPVATVLLVHGFPDLGHGWRYQFPYLLSKNLQVIVPDMLGYGQTDAPDDANEYTLKKISDHIAGIVETELGPGKQIILGGHDWGGLVVWRVAQWYPQMIKGVFSVCTPYVPPNPTKITLEQMVQLLPNFTYQVHFAGPEVEAVLGSNPQKIRQFLNTLYGGRGPNGESAFNVKKGVIFENLDKIGSNPFMDKETIDFYVNEYARHGMHGPLNWYRLRELTHEEELPLVEKLKKGELKFKMPSMIIVASDDEALPPSMAQGMPAHFENLRQEEVKATHWALWQQPDQVNGYIGSFIDSVLGGSAKASL